MAKRTLTAKQIMEEINRRLADSLDMDCRECRILIPRPARGEDYGGNWRVGDMEDCTRGCIVELGRIVGEVRNQYDCSDW